MFLCFEPFSKIRDWSSSRKNLYLKPVRYLTQRSRTSPLLASTVKVSRCSAIGREAPRSAYNGGEQLLPSSPAGNLGVGSACPCMRLCAWCPGPDKLDGERSVLP